jgi:hypothetical protein
MTHHRMQVPLGFILNVSLSDLKGHVARRSDDTSGVCVCVYVCVYMCMRICARVCVCVCVCVCVRVDMFASMSISYLLCVCVCVRALTSLVHQLQTRLARLSLSHTPPRSQRARFKPVRT